MNWPKSILQRLDGEKARVGQWYCDEITRFVPLTMPTDISDLVVDTSVLEAISNVQVASGSVVISSAHMESAVALRIFNGVRTLESVRGIAERCRSKMDGQLLPVKNVRSLTPRSSVEGRWESA